MDVGFLLEERDGSMKDVTEWVEGAPEKGWFGGSKGLRSPVTDVDKPRTLGSVKRLDGGFGHIVP